MTDSVFTKMLKGEVPRELIYEDDVCFVIPTIGPHNPGHIMVISKKQIEEWQDLDKPTYLHCMEVTQRFGKLLKNLYACPKVLVEIVGFEVPHVHIHLIPAYKMIDMDHTSAKVAQPEDLKKEADKIRTALGEQN